MKSRGLLALVLIVASIRTSNADDLSILFLGDNGHHRPRDRSAELIPVLETRGIDVTYTDRLDDLAPEVLAKYDGLIIYANWTKYEPKHEKALLDYVAGGGGFIPLHCASYCFIQSQPYIDLVGAQFHRHGTGVFRTRVVEPEHPVCCGLWEFETWDETYVHRHHNEKNRTVLQVRKEGDRDEPWTWVRTHGKGRIFYTAYGHDSRTFTQPAFHALVERGIRWACGDDGIALGSRRTDVEPFEYTKAKLPNYRTKPDAVDRVQLPVSPEESSKHLLVPRGFEFQLFASEPDIFKPICMAWDERGRMWIAETKDYPNSIKPQGQGSDQIKICTDTDGDGRADEFTVFADKLSIPTSICFARGGLIVHQAPQTLFLADTDGDDRADVREVLFSGWSTGDTHAGPSNMRYGFDNQIWGIVGYAGYGGTIGGEQHRFATGFYRFRPDGSKFEFLRNTNNNSWGVGFTEDGILFGSTANRNPSVYMPISNRYYERVRGWSSQRLETCAISPRFYPITDLVRQVDHHGCYTAAAGHAVYTARLFPKYYWNRTAFVTGPTGHLVGTFEIERVGADVLTRNTSNLAASDDEWTAPIVAEVGPDGAVWMIDWYNYIVQHNPTPRGFKTGRGNAYETELRDKVHGRIYRIAPKGAKLPPPLRLDRASPATLVATLRHDNQLWRFHAQRLLVERGKKDVVPALTAIVTTPKVDEIGLDVGAIHALWTLHGLDAIGGPSSPTFRATVGALAHASAGVRRAALKVLPSTPESTAAILRSGLLLDDDGQVRLAAFLALADMPSSQDAGQSIATAFVDPRNANDRWIPDAATSAAAIHDVGFLDAVASDRSAGDNSALMAIIGRVAEHWARGKPVDTLAELVAKLRGASRPVADAVVTGLAKGWP